MTSTDTIGVDRVTVATRGWLDIPPPRGSRRVGWSGDRFLIFDSETRITPDQTLTFGCWRYCVKTDSGEFNCVDEGLFYADDLPTRDPVGFTCLVDYAAIRNAARGDGRPRPLRLLSRAEFVEKVFYQAAYKGRATVVGFNLPFDLSRIAVRVYRRRVKYGGGFSLSFWQHKGEHSRYRPLVNVRHMTRHFSFIGFSRRKGVDTVDLIPDGSPDAEPDEEYAFPGYFLDLRTLGFALTNVGYDLARAAYAFGARPKSVVDGHGVITPDYIDYCRNDVAVTAELAEKMLARYAAHPIELAPTKAFSPASIAKAYLRAMGVTPVLRRQRGFPQDILGAAMTAFYGGRTECRLRRVAVPVEVVDFTSMYPTVDCLLGIWELLTAQHIEVIDVTTEVQRLLDRVTVEDCLHPGTWKQLVGFGWITPDDDALPVRGDYFDNGTYTIGIQHYSSPLEQAYALPDLLASKLLAGKPPTLRRAVRLVASGGLLPGLRSVRLGGQIEVDPYRDDFFREVIRQRLPYKRRAKSHDEMCGCDDCVMSGFLKVLANSGAYGIFAELNPKALPARKTERHPLWTSDPDPVTVPVAKPEAPGEYCFPPTAACITAAARLMLAILERLVTDAGGVWAFCDTDSMAILAAEHAGSCPNSGASIFDYATVASIRDRFRALNPYGTGDSILDLQTRQYCFAISAKRYRLHPL